MRRCPECGYEELPCDLRSTKQNRWYWIVVVGPIRDFLEFRNGMAYQKEEVHEGLKAGFLGFVANPLGGPAIPRSTTSLTVAEFTDYCDRIMADFSREHGVEFMCL